MIGAPRCGPVPYDRPRLVSCALSQDIRINGLLHPIVVHRGQIVDGRLLACRERDIEPRFVESADAGEKSLGICGAVDL